MNEKSKNSTKKSGPDTYVTAGTIHVELDRNGKTTNVLVTPTSDFVVKFGKDSYIVLLPLDPKEKKIFKDAETRFINAKFRKLENLIFSVSGHSESVLTQVAIKGTVIEMHCAFETDDTVKVVSLKIPASS